MITPIIMGLTVLSGLAVVIHHAGYPLLLRWFQKRKSHSCDADKAREWRGLEVIIPMYNEAAFVQDKLWNLAALDYPADRVVFRLILDGCSDNTEALIRETLALAEFDDENFQIEAYEQNQGKVARLNQAIASADADVVVISDGSALLSIDALAEADLAFSDPSIGVLTGKYQLWGDQAAGQQDYWTYQTHLKQQESDFGALMGAHGAFFALRTACFQPLPNGAINDDFLFAMQGQTLGFRGRYLHTVNAIELERASIQQDSQRRVRLAAGNVQQNGFVFSQLSSFNGRLLVLFFLGKGLRPAMPFLMLSCLIGCALLSSESLIFSIGLGLQLIGYAIAGFGMVFPHHSPRLIKTLAYLVNGHMRSAQGALIYLFNPSRFTRWQRV